MYLKIRQSFNYFSIFQTIPKKPSFLFFARVSIVSTDPSTITNAWLPRVMSQSCQFDAPVLSSIKGGGHKTSDAESLGEETLEELTSAEKKLIDKMYDKKGNLTPIGKAVMDAGKMRGKSPSQMGVLTKKK